MSNNYVCVKSGETVKRLLRVDAEKLVASGWSFCPRSLWKEKVRGSVQAVTPNNAKAHRKPKNVTRKPKTDNGKGRKIDEREPSQQ
jgi:hypothetical protein